MIIEKFEGVTPTEKLLAKYCENTFFKLWSYANPYNDKHDELCDLLAVFENHIYIFFDRENLILEDKSKNPEVSWNRWKKKVIDDQIRTAKGAERYILSGREIFLDQKNLISFPIKIDHEKSIVHKIIIAHGAKNACKDASIDNIYGSLAISYGPNDIEFPLPFFIHLDKNDPVHIFDSYNLPIIFSELDTFYDFTSYIEEKENAINKYDSLVYCGEEDLLAHYFLNFNEDNNNHYIGTLDTDINGIYIGEGEWHEFKKHKQYIARKEADKISSGMT